MTLRFARPLVAVAVTVATFAALAATACYEVPEPRPAPAPEPDPSGTPRAGVAAPVVSAPSVSAELRAVELVTQVHDGRRHRSFAAVIDTCAFDAPIARAHFDHALPYAMHGSWVETERGG